MVPLNWFRVDNRIPHHSLVLDELSALHLRQRDGVTCGPSVAVVAGALLDPAYRAALMGPGAHDVGGAGRARVRGGPDRPAVGAAGRACFSGEQGRVHAQVNRLWPRWLGTTPMGMARAITAHSAPLGVRYRWRLVRGRRDQV